MTKVTYIPKGSMCMVCKKVYDNCSHLPFHTYRPMEKVDNEGCIVVLCPEFDKEETDDEG